MKTLFKQLFQKKQLLETILSGLRAKTAGGGIPVDANFVNFFGGSDP